MILTGFVLYGSLTPSDGSVNGIKRIQPHSLVVPSPAHAFVDVWRPSIHHVDSCCFRCMVFWALQMIRVGRKNQVLWWIDVARRPRRFIWSKMLCSPLYSRRRDKPKYSSLHKGEVPSLPGLHKPSLSSCQLSSPLPRW